MMNLELESMAIQMPVVAQHPNREAFHGVLTLVDVPSDKPPSGSRGHRVVLTRAAAEAALASLLGMGLDYAPSLDRHDTRRKIGVITRAEIVGRDFRTWRTFICPGLSRDCEGDQKISGSGASSASTRALGMSYEITDARVADIRSSIWILTHVTFTGAAVLRRDKAAYHDTWIELE